jgi:dolichyl-phosphate beta-glucosyltransferase
MKLSVVIPVYNEERRIKDSLDKINKYLKNKNYEIIVVDDGSTDKTREIVQKFKNIIITKKRKNKGKGYSVKQGMLMAKGEYVLFLDADLSTPIEELGEFLKLIKKYDVVIGSRAIKGSKVKTSWYRKLLGRIGNFFISILAVKNIKDTQCGFKLFRKEAAKKIFEKQTINGWGFDFEILHIAQKLGFSIKEQPVNWTLGKESKVKLTDYPKTLIELFKIWINELKGMYS